VTTTDDVVWKMDAVEGPPQKKVFVPPPEEVNLLQKSLDLDSHMAHVNRSGFDLLGGLKGLIKSFKVLDKCLNQQPKYKIMSLLDFLPPDSANLEIQVRSGMTSLKLMWRMH